MEFLLEVDRNLRDFDRFGLSVADCVPICHDNRELRIDAVVAKLRTKFHGFRRSR
jgi:hypothetical protein